MALCASYKPDFGTGRRRTRGYRASRGRRRVSSGTQSMTAPRLLLFDSGRAKRAYSELAADREPGVVLTAPWHERDHAEPGRALGVPVYAPPPEPAVAVPGQDAPREPGIRLTG